VRLLAGLKAGCAPAVAAACRCCCCHGMLSLPRLQEYRSDLASTRGRLREAESALQSDNLGFGARGKDDLSSSSYDQLRTSTRRLDEKRRTALETEDVDLELLSNMHSQREGIMCTIRRCKLLGKPIVLISAVGSIRSSKDGGSVAAHGSCSIDRGRQHRVRQQGCCLGGSMVSQPCSSTLSSVPCLWMGAECLYMTLPI